MFRLPLLIFLLSSHIAFTQGVLSVGQWRDHLSYYNPIMLKAGDHKVFAATKQGIAVYNTIDNSTSRITRINGLSDVDISAISYSEENDLLMIAYENGNVDLIKDGITINLPDIKRSTMVGDKGIYSIHARNDLAYLACGFGIVVIDLKKLEVKDTYKIGPGGSALRVNYLAFKGDTIYAATQAGIYAADANDPFLNNFETWYRFQGFPDENNSFNYIGEFAGRMFANYDSGSENDRLYEYLGGTWQLSSLVSNYELKGFNINGNKMLLSLAYEVRVFDNSLTMIDKINSNNIPGEVFWAQDAVFADGFYYYTDRFQGIFKTKETTDIEAITPNGPLTNNAWDISASSGVVYVASGAVSSAYNPSFKQDGISYFDGSRWKFLDERTDTLLKQSFDLLSVVPSPSVPGKVYVGSWTGGLIEIEDGRASAVYNKHNTNGHIQEVPVVPGWYRVASSAFDKSGNLWVANSNAARNLVLKSNSNQWFSFPMGADFGNPTGTVVSKVIVAQDNTKWMIRNRLGLYAFNENGTFEDPNDDQYRALSTTEGSGGLPSTDVFSIVEDLDGEIWIGTDKGFAIFYSPSLVFSNDNFTADQPIILQDGNYEKILETEKITAIAIDGANRKWMATENSGVYLLSEDGTEQVLHFTAENSPLLSNEVFSIAVNQQTGEVFFGTSRGIQSYQSDAIGERDCAEGIQVYPTPVRPNYQGTISIRGFVRDSDVKITDIAGNVIFTTRSLGGQASWDGKNFRGERPATGIYLVFAADLDCTDKPVGKIMFVR